MAVKPWWKMFAGLVLFSVAFGYVEAAVVAYLRALYFPLRLHFFPGASASDLFPLLTLDQLQFAGSEHLARVRIELGREIATLLMLAGVALTATSKVREWVAAFLICFGIWDITFYAFLKVLLNWPESMLTWDILFLVPVPWVGPVIAPVIVSVTMIAAGVTVLWRERARVPVFIARSHWALILLGGCIVVAAFIADFVNTSRGGNPNAFHWGLFALGEIVGVGGFLAASLRRTPAES
jgi:hypothetical protein